MEREGEGEGELEGKGRATEFTRSHELIELDPPTPMVRALFTDPHVSVNSLNSRCQYTYWGPCSAESLTLVSDSVEQGPQ